MSDQAPATPVQSAPVQTPAPVAPPAPVSPPVAAPVAPVPPVQAAPPVDNTIVMTQEEYNQRLASHRVTMQRELATAKQQNEALTGLKDQVQSLLESGLLGEVEGLDGFAEAAQNTLTGLMTDQERLATANATQQKQLEAAQTQAQQATQRYEAAQIDRATKDGIGDRASSSAAKQWLADTLKPFATVGDDGVVTYEMEVKGENGEVQKQKLSAADAVGILEADKKNYGPAFKSTVNAGLGNELTEAVVHGPDGNVDLGKMSPEQFMEIHAKDPSALDRMLASIK